MASNKMLIDASHPEETRVVVLRGNRIEEFDFESQNKRQLKGNIYLAKVTRVEPSLQAAFVDYGGNRHGFLAFNEIHPDYYQIPVADRQALLDEEAADAALDNAEDDAQSAKLEQADIASDNPNDSPSDSNGDENSDEKPVEAKPKRRPRRSRRKSNAPKASDDAVKADAETADSGGDAASDDKDATLAASDGKSDTAAQSTGDEPVETEKDQVSQESAPEENATKAESDGDALQDNSLSEPENPEASTQDTGSDTENASDEVASTEDGDGTDADDQSEGSEGSEDRDKPTSIAAIMETDSISEPAPDEETAGEDGTEEEASGEEPTGDVDAPAESAAEAGETEDGKAEAAAKKSRRVSRRPRKKAKAETVADLDNAAEAGNPSEAAADVEVAAIAADETSSVDKEDDKEIGENPAEIAPENESQTDNSEAEAEEAPKSKTRRRRRSTRSRKNKETAQADSADEDAGANNKNGNNNDNGNDNNGDDEVESSGQEDALEEVPQRRRPRRQYKIQEVVKRRQVLLVQVVKEERGNKGAALTTYLSLAGRYSVLMPNTARGGGISRKITNSADRKRLKTIASELEVPQGMGVILRTAGASRTKAEIQRDFEYLMRLWENVRSLTLSSSAPCLVYEEGSLIKRSIRDLYDKNTGEVLVAGAEGHREAHEFMAMLMPSHANKVKLYRDEQAILARFGVEQQLDKMLSQQVTLKSGGYLVIDQTEALVAIDVNSGRATREHSIEDTALQTNLETAEEVARQLRLRDLAGLIVIDFIDMEEKRNNRAVEKKLKECLKHDRARIQVGRISHFGLLEMSRQRMRASVLDSTMDICPHCQGKGHVRSNSTVSLHILRAIDEHLLKNSRFDLVVKAASDVALYILNHKRSALMEIEERFGLKIFVEENRELLGENFTLEKGEPSTGERIPVTHIQAGVLPDEIDTAANDADADQAANQPDDQATDKQGSDNQTTGRDTGRDTGRNEETTGKRRRRRRGKKEETTDETTQEASQPQNSDGESESDAEAGKRKRPRGRRAGRNRRKPVEATADATAETAVETTGEASANAESAENTANAEASEVAPENTSADAPVLQDTGETKPKRTRRSRNSRPGKVKAEVKDTNGNNDDKASPEADVSKPENSTPVEVAATEQEPVEPAQPKRRTTRRRAKPKAVKADATGVQDDQSTSEVEPAKADNKAADEVAKADTAVAQNSDNAPADNEDKQGGWWSRSGFFK